MPRNEGKACDAAVKCIEQRTGKKRNDIRLPEKDHVGPPVELRLKIGTQEYAIEHTQIEAFEGQISGGVSLEHLARPIKKALCGKLPGPAIYTIFFPPDCELIVNKPNLKNTKRNSKSGFARTLHVYTGRFKRESAVNQRMPSRQSLAVSNTKSNCLARSPAFLPTRNQGVLEPAAGFQTT